MRIWYINPYAGGPGIGRYWRAHHLAREWTKSGHDVTVVTGSYHHLMDFDAENKSSKSIEGVRYLFVRTTKYKGNGLSRFISMLFFSMSLFFYGIKYSLMNKPDLIVYSSAHPFGYFSAWLLKLIFGAKLFFEVRDLWPLSLLQIAKVKTSNPVIILLSVIERFAYKTCDSAISLLPGAESHMEAKGLGAGKFIYVPNGFSADSIVSGDDQGSNPLILDIVRFKADGDFLFFYAGAFGEPNAMHKFLDSLAFFDGWNQKKVKFILVGQGEQQEQLRDRCEKNGYDYVRFYSQVDKRVVMEALSLIDVGFFVMHDLPIYKFGVSLNKLFDYMSTAVPIVGAYKAFNDPIYDAKCGVSVFPDNPKGLADAFLAIATCSKDELREMGQRGRLYLEEHHEYSILADRILSKVQHDE